MNREALRALPSVNSLLETPIGQALITRYGHDQTTDAVRYILQMTRDAIINNTPTESTQQRLLQQIEHHLKQQTQPTLRQVINGTGVIIHTNLGRAPLSDDAIQAMNAVAAQYNTLEFDLNTGGRGSRNIHAEKILPEIVGAEAALVVNNCASALLLVLTALARNREVIVSRGQLVEIGGGFRIPEIMTQGGASLVGVGTTNKTRAADYANAVTDQTAMLLRVHASNFMQVGFTETAAIEDMASTARKHNLLLVDDVGSGALIDTTQFGLSPEPLVQHSIAAGADLVLFSGDKLLGGPQAGIIVGKRDAIDKLKRHPFNRALRADKLVLAALTATLDHYRRDEALKKVPVWWMISRELCDLARIAKRWSKQFPNADIQKGNSTVGGGSIPGSTLSTVLLSLDVPHPTDFVARFRAAETPVIARIADDKVLIDPRTVFPEQEEHLLRTIDQSISNE